MKNIILILSLMSALLFSTNVNAQSKCPQYSELNQNIINGDYKKIALLIKRNGATYHVYAHEERGWLVTHVFKNKNEILACPVDQGPLSFLFSIENEKEEVDSDDTD